MTIFTYELLPEHDSAKSFYGKARVVILSPFEVKFLTSYGVEVAKIENGQATVFDTYSQTTLRHIKEFLKQDGFKAESKGQIENDYVEAK